LKNVTVEIPLARFVCVTGVSGSGKSSLVNDILARALARDLNGAESDPPGDHDDIIGAEHLDKIIVIDQSPIGRTPRSNPATYIKVFDEIRALFARLPDSRVRGHAPGRFSFNVPSGERGGGRCEACEGNGANRVEMDFLADVWVTCPVCEGRRFNHETLQVRYRGKSIADVLDMDVQEALEHFDAIPKIRAMLATLHDVGLDYVKLGQSSTTLSGGEAQRIKLARELVKKSTGRTLYLLDEPTTGLHFEDIRRLLAVLHGFVDAGNTVVVIEHQLDVVKTADWIIDLGPEGGEAGGRVVADGTPENVARRKTSYTGQALREMLRIGTSAKKQRMPTKQARTTTRKHAQPTNGPGTDFLEVVGAKEHNLRDLTVRLPRGAMTVCSGVSGSGKSSFAIDTVYTEGHRRYVESLSAYARQFLGQLQKPKVDHVYGLSPAISIEQKQASKSPRSTVGTVTEIYDYMRVLWARIGQPYCPKCDVPIGTQTSEEIVDKLLDLPAPTQGDAKQGNAGVSPAHPKLLLCAPITRNPGETWEAALDRWAQQGFVRARIDGQVVELANRPQIDARRHHAVELVVDRAVVRTSARSRIADSVEQCLAISGGVLLAVITGADEPDKPLRFSQFLSCDRCGTSYDEITPHHLSFNARMGWCPACEGLGVQRGTRADAVFMQPDASVLDGGIAGWDDAPQRPLLRAMIVALARAIGFDPDTPTSDIAPEHRRRLLFGLGDEWIAPRGNDVPPGLRFQWKGFMPAVDEAVKSSWQYRSTLSDQVSDVPCQTCAGGRIRPEGRAVRLDKKSIVDVCEMSLADAAAYFKRLRLDRRQARIAGELLHEIKARLRFLLDVGLGYLTLARAAPTLSGGEAQRIRLASQIGSGLTGVLYVLDEPTIGLHPRDNKRLINALHKLRDLGNTLLMVEHDREVIESANHLLDFGPGAGIRGGALVAGGTPTQVKRNGDSLTGRFLSGRDAIPVPRDRRPVIGFDGAHADTTDDDTTPALTIIGSRQNNLRNVDVALPLGRFICVTGVSGSGKSSLINDILYPVLATRIHRARMPIGAHKELRGIDHVDKVINVDQQPIGNSPLSNPATYTGLFDIVRELFARLPESKVRGYTANRFSFNRPGGRCDDCDGLGQVCHEMHFLPDVWVPCETCGGSRYQRETLEVRYKGKNIADVLSMQVSEALTHFENVPKVRHLLQTLVDVGLDYLPLGQSAPTLSGGEAQRVKLATELGRPSTGRTVYILDEPTTGLHFDDLRKLLDVLHRFVDLGNTVVCIEHNLDVIKTADWIIDLGPEAGDAGGTIVAEGTPERLAACPASHTGRLLKQVLAAGPRVERKPVDAERLAAEMARVQRSRLVVGEQPEKMPWQRDGRRWHTAQRIGRDGKPVEWEGAALDFVVDQIEKLGGDRLAPTDWNDRARIEITARAPEGLSKSAVPWLLHALTGGHWLLDLLFRVPRGTFKLPTLRRRLKLPSLDERDDIPAYSSNDRVQMRRATGDLDHIRILVHDKKEIATPAFRTFLKQAVAAYLDHVDHLAGETVDAEPWKTDGKAWHLSQRCIPLKQDKRWRPVELIKLLGRIGKIAPMVRPLWDRKVFVELVEQNGRRVGKIITSKGEALRVDLHVPPGRFTPTQVEHLGIGQAFAHPGTSGAELTFWFQDLDQVHDGVLRDVVAAAADHASNNGNEP